MTQLDIDLRQKAWDVVQAFGKMLVFDNNAGVGAGIYDPDSGTFKSAPPPMTYAYKTSPPQSYVRRFADAAVDVEGQVEVTLPALNLSAIFEADYLRPGMRVSFDGDDWRCLEVEKLYSGDLVTAYRIIMSQQSGT